MTNFDLMRQRLLDKAGLSPSKAHPFSGRSFQSLITTEWSDEFECLMRNRLAMGALRYGPIARLHTHKKRYGTDRIEAMAKEYHETGNTELLVDIANFCLLAFIGDNHPKKHFYAKDR